MTLLSKHSMLESAVLNVQVCGITRILSVLSPEPSSQSSIPVYSDASHCLAFQLGPQMEKVRQECQDAYLIEKES